jgi:serine/threonine-protein phosphatase CPPED1
MMKFFKFIIGLILLFSVTEQANAQKRGSSSPYFFIQMSDPQFGFIESENGTWKETELYEKAVKEINRLKPDFIVITGDFTGNKNNRSQITEFKRITAEIDPKIPVYLSPGNHDIEEPLQENNKTYISEYGYDRFAFKHKKSLFIGLNSFIIKINDPVMEQAQFDWLKKKLSKGKKAEHKVIFCHYPFFLKEFDEPDSYFNISSETRKRYFALFKENNVDAVFAGHRHINSYSKYGNIEMITTGAVGKPLGKDPSGVRIIKVYTDRIESFYYGLDELPEAITFD